MAHGPGSKEHWGTRVGVILAVTGSAVGLGNFLRFPGLAAQYEGGAFMVPYFLALLLLGLPLAWAEWAMGRYGGARGYNSTPGIYRSIWKNRAAPYFGVIGMVVPVVIYMYYVVIEAWCLAYAFFFLNGQMQTLGASRAADGTLNKAAYVSFFEKFTGTAQDGAAFAGGGQRLLLFVLVCFLLNFTLIYSGLRRGIERFCLMAMPALIMCALLVLLRVLTLPGVSDGLGFMWNPVVKPEHAVARDKGLDELVGRYDKLSDPSATPAPNAAPSVSRDQVAAGQWIVAKPQALQDALAQSAWQRSDGQWWTHKGSKLRLTVDAENRVVAEHRGFLRSLMNGQMWLDATGQIFFSLSVGFGIIITYSSYLRRNDDVALSSLTACAGNEFCEVALGGLITIPAAFIFLGAVQVTEVSGSSFNLGFKTLPMVFEQMPFGHTVGFLFFFLLFLAAITSSLSMLQPAIALLEEGLGLNRRASVAVLGFVTLMGSALVLFFSKDSVALGTMDFWVGTFFIFLLATFQTILFGWGLGIDKGMKELDRGAALRVPRIVGFCLKYVSPVYLLVVFAFWLYAQITTKGEDNQFWRIVHLQPVAMTVGFIVVMLAFFLLLIAQSVRRWERAELTKEVRS